MSSAIKSNNFIDNQPSNLAELIKLSENSKVVIAFSASWLGATEILEVVFDKLRTFNYDGYQFVQYDIEYNKEISEFFQVRKLPTIIVLSKGEVIDRFTDTISKKKIINRLGL